MIRKLPHRCRLLSTERADRAAAGLGHLAYKSAPMMLETPRRSGDFNSCRRMATSAVSRQAHRTSRPGPDRPRFLERPWRSGCGRRAEVETAFKAGTVDTGSASALQGTDLASSILHQLRQHLTSPVSARARGVSRSVSAWGPPPARPIYRTGGSLESPSLETRRLRLDTFAQCVAQLCRPPGTSNTCECVAGTQTGVVRRAVAPGGHGHVAFHPRVMGFVASLDLYRKVHKEPV